MILKIGGACLRKPRFQRALAEQIATVQALGGKPVVVHGGGPQIDAVQRSLGEEPRMVDGRRVTSPTALRALRMATAGELNGELASALTSAGAKAVGICAADAGIVTADKRSPQETSEGEVDFGAVGDVRSVDPQPLLGLLAQGVTPVICPPVGDGQGGFLNLNADTLAAALACSLDAAKLVLLTGEAGILADPHDPESVLSVLGLETLDALEQDGALQKGMKVKAAAVRAALTGGVPKVHIVSGVDPEALLVELYTNHGSGTLITADEPAAAPMHA